MAVILKEFQTKAVNRVVGELRRARAEFDGSDGEQYQAVVLSALTGSGKTVIATVAIERLMFGDDTVAADEQATFLWLTDQPELNEQTRRKMMTGPERLGLARLVVMTDAFDEPRLSPGHVYFLNTQKLATSALTVRRGNHRRSTFWETLNNSVADRSQHLYLIIDEAHRGMAEDADPEEAKSIIQRFIKGSPEIAKFPVILGVSATPDRFTSLVGRLERTMRPVEVTAEEVRKSGLIKERVSVRHAGEAQRDDMALLGRAVVSWRQFADDWRAHCEAQKESLVDPILVVQVEDADGENITRSNLRALIATIRDTAGIDLPDDAFAHSFGIHTEVAAGGSALRYIAPADITDDPKVRVVFFKTSLSVGWDCPRAEVMFSLRSARDYTNIAQLVGRMVRTPLARSVDDNEHLNTVALFLPDYDRAQLKRVVDQLTSEGGALAGTEVTDEPTVTLYRSPDSEQAFAKLCTLVSYDIPTVPKVSYAKRLQSLANLLSRDNIDPDAYDREIDALAAVLLAERTTRATDPDFADKVSDHATLTVANTRFLTGEHELAEDENELVPVTEASIVSLFGRVKAHFGPELAERYLKKRMLEHADARTARLEMVVLTGDPRIRAAIETQGQDRSQALLRDFGVHIRDLPEGKRAGYERLRAQSTLPEGRPFEPPLAIEANARHARWAGHLLADRADGLAPLRLNTWEEAVVREEIARPDTVGWLRNQERKKWALRVPYEMAARTTPVFPDFLVVRRVGEHLVVDLLDPHNPGLPDSLAKAKGLARYAAQHGLDYGRIELLAQFDGLMARIDLQREDVREAVLRTEATADLRPLFAPLA